MDARRIFLILLIKLFCLSQKTTANEVLGCGGFIKSHADIDFSKVEIKLLTKQGALKDKTDCSPSNGYYFLPIYDKGEYILRVSPPPGWSFEPEQFRFNFDGKSDVCSQGKDVNFAFKGFGITGKVSLAAYDKAGANGVDVELRSEDGKDVRRTVTDINGVFSFSPVIPGKYVVQATHKSWHFSKSEHKVVVVSGNTELPANSLIVSGFDVTGRFDANGEEAVGIGVALFRTKNQILPMKCSNEFPINLGLQSSEYESRSICYANINKDSSYTLPGVAPGKYVLQPVVRDSKLNINISPSFIEFVVEKDTLIIREEFKITGFSATGKVLESADGAPLSEATVKLNGKIIGVTHNNGSFKLENVRSGTYTLNIEAPKMKFAEQKLALKLSNPIIPTIVPSEYEVCGVAISTKSHVISISDEGDFYIKIETNAETGEWCVYLPNGKFNLALYTSLEEKREGFHFFPEEQQIEVKSQPIDGIIFSQLRSTLTGEIKCLPDAPIECTGVKVTLHALDSRSRPTGLKLFTKANDGKYEFDGMFPGPYEVTIPSRNICYDVTRSFVYLGKASVTATPFVHLGYEFNVVSSHRATLKYVHNTPGSTTESLKLKVGVNTFCVPKLGTYDIKLEGCHIYEEDLPSNFTIAMDYNLLNVKAMAHKTGVRVLSTDPDATNIELHIETDALGKQIITPIAEDHKVDGKYAFRYETYLKEDEVLRITPMSDILLFTPQKHDIVGTNDCVDIAFNFVATRGMILSGKVVPAIKNVKIFLKFPNQPDVVPETTLTTILGEFKFGPIDQNVEYELIAEKESYVFSPYNRETASFSAHKLCEIVVRVKDEHDKKLSGVLLSLSGSESYRKNLVTGENGAITFHSLSPSQYFLRPMMKEYKFEPNSKIIDIKDGETATVELIGKRVAYSAFGTITSLNGQPFSQVIVEAISDEQCMQHQEEATSEKNGQYRLRGLQPGCTYTIRLKQTAKVERSIPKTRNVEIKNEDVRNINLIAISPITFVDVTARVTAQLNDHYKTLRIVMYRKGASDSPIYSQKIETPLNPKLRQNPGIMVFFPRIPLDGKTYIVELRSTLSDKSYTYALPSEEFVANTSSMFVELDFQPEVRATEGDLNQNSISALILVAVVVIIFFKQEIAMNLLNFICAKISNAAEIIAQRRRNNKKELRRNEPINQREIELMAEQINAIKKKKTKKI